MEKAGRFLNRALDYLIILLFILMIGFSVTAVIDAVSVYMGADDNVKSYVQYKPFPEGGDDAGKSLQDLARECPDTVAWITVKDTKIDYPVVQGVDNEQYVNHGVDGKFLISGSIFLDFRNNKDFTDRYSILYGHHMEHDEMFGGLDRFRSQEYLEKYATGYLYTPERTYTIHPFAAAVVMSNDNLFDPFLMMKEKDIPAYVKERSVSYTFHSGNHFLALSTCSSAQAEERTVILCWMEDKDGNTDGVIRDFIPEEEPEEEVLPFRPGPEPFGSDPAGLLIDFAAILLVYALIVFVWKLTAAKKPEKEKKS